MNHLERERKSSRRRLDKLGTLDGIRGPQTEEKKPIRITLEKFNGSLYEQIDGVAQIP